MAIKILGGFRIDNFSVDTAANQEKIKTHLDLIDEGILSGAQILVGPDVVNKTPIDDLRNKIEALNIPYVVHAPHEGVGVDLGERVDETDTFVKYNREHPEITWRDFNLAALNNAIQLAQGKLVLNPNIVLHSGYALHRKKLDTDIYLSIVKIISALNGPLSSGKFSLETVPAFVVTEPPKPAIVTHYAFGGIVEDMKDILGNEKLQRPGSVLMDFTHMGVTANQMEKIPEYFGCPAPKTYEGLVNSFLQLPGISSVVHFSGHHDFLWATHMGIDGFKEANTRKEEERRKIMKDALRELESRNQDLYVALEIRFKDAASYRKEVERFSELYL